MLPTFGIFAKLSNEKEHRSVFCTSRCGGIFVYLFLQCLEFIMFWKTLCQYFCYHCFTLIPFLSLFWNSIPYALDIFITSYISCVLFFCLYFPTFLSIFQFGYLLLKYLITPYFFLLCNLLSYVFNFCYGLSI